MNRFSDAETIDSVLFQAMGAASMCWSVPPKGIFDSTTARQIGDEAIERINELTSDRDGYWGRNPDTHDRDGQRIAP